MISWFETVPEYNISSISIVFIGPNRPLDELEISGVACDQSYVKILFGSRAQGTGESLDCNITEIGREMRFRGL